MDKHIYLFFRKFSKICGYAVLLGMVAVMTLSCGGSKKSSSMRQLNKHSKKYPVDEEGIFVPSRGSESKKVKAAMAKQQKQKEAEQKEAEKAYKEGITRHRSLQSPEMLERMDQHLKESEKRKGNKKEFFLVRWFRPKDDIKRIEDRRDKELKKHMAATRKTAEKNNETRTTSSFKGTPRESVRPQPGDTQHGGGGTYREGSAPRANPSDIQVGGGGTYVSGSSKKKAKASNIQQGGGGTYREKKSKKR